MGWPCAYKLAAAQGNAMAQSILGAFFYAGKGVLQDYAEAVKWLKLAAAQGHAQAQRDLGFMYGAGQGVAEDMVRAHMWFNLAAAKGNGSALESRDLTSRHMTPKQIAQSQKLARACQARDYKGCN